MLRVSKACRGEVLGCRSGSKVDSRPFSGVSASCRLCRFFGACEYSDRRLRNPGGLLLLWIQRHPRASVLPSLHEAVACMSSR